MADSILDDTKQLLGLAQGYKAFDQNITIFINACLGTLNQLGIGPISGLKIASEAETWDILGTPDPLTELCQAYVFLKTKMLFDPPTARFPIQAMEEQLAEMAWRIQAMVDSQEPTSTTNADGSTTGIYEPTRPTPPGPDPNQEEWWAMLP